MASFIALSSSPDPLGTDFEPPGSMRPPPTQRTGPPTTASRSHSRRQSGRISIPASTTQRSSWGTESPRRQTFELDVGNGRSPQRLLVTVEAEEPSQRSVISRRLFGGSSSPTRSRSRRRDTMGGATTTMVPLRGLTDDEGGDLNTPRGRSRGRPLGSKNGTPAPRGKKRTGTPLLKESRPTRRRKNSEYGESALSDAPLDMGTDGPEPQDPTPKPKPNARKNTPARKAGTPAASSSKPTGRKRGRPRKSVVPEEAAVVKDASKEPEPVLDTDLLLPSEDGMDQISAQAPHEQPRAETAPSDNPMPSVSLVPEEDTPRNVSSRRHQLSPDKSQSVDRTQQSAHESRDADYDEPLSDVYMREPSSDIDTDVGAGEDPYASQDTLAHASDFTMIALDTLPSFQASFQASRSGLQQDPGPSAFDQAGEETNMMINQTMESLRSSGQGQAQPEAPRENTVPATGTASSSVPAQSSPSSYALSSPQVWSRSPRRPKSMPLSKQVFVNKAQAADDSPSSKPGSVRKGATPSKLSTQQSGAAVENADPDLYDDSFSEIPDEVLEAATPKPPSRTARTSGTGAHGVQPYEQEAQVMSHTGFPLGQNKLPTPDDTNSSTTGSKNAQEQEDDSRRKAGDATLALNTSDLNIHSSPPAFHQRRTHGSEMEPELGPEARAGIEPEPEHSYSGSNHSESPSPLASPSPQRPPAAAPDTKAEPAKTLEPSATGPRPTLSPIVRVGRSLQNVMSDRSSPEGRGSSLGSPFRGSASVDSRQSSIQKSPGTEQRESVNQTGSRSFFNPLASLAQSIRSNFSQVSRHAPSSPTAGQAEGPFGPKSPERSSPLSSTGTPAGESAEGAEPSPYPGKTTQPRSMVSSATVPPLSETATGDWTPMESSPSTRRTKRMAAPKSSATANPTNSGVRGHNSNASRSLEPERVQAAQHHGQPLEYTKEPEAERKAPEEEEEFSDSDFEHVEAGEQEDNGDWERGEEQDILATDVGQGDRNGSVEEIRTSLEDVDPQDAIVDGQFGDADDDMDIWDFEASRATPQSPRDAQMDEETRRDSHSYMDGRSSQAPLQLSTNTGPARRPSPFRKITRRLIYKDDFKSPSHIDLDESPPSEKAQESSAVPGAKAQEMPQETAPVRVDDVPRKAQAEAEVAPDQPERDDKADDIRDESPDYQFPEEIRDDSPEHADGIEDIRGNTRDRHVSEGSRNDSPERDLLLELGGPMEDVAPSTAANPPNSIRRQASQQSRFEVAEEQQMTSPGAQPEDYSLLLDQEEATEVDEHHAVTATETEDYSLLSRQRKGAEKQTAEETAEKAAPRRSGLFGGFDIMSFFSSPAALPPKDGPQSQANAAAPKAISKFNAQPPRRGQPPSSDGHSLPEEPQSAPRATGLFPSISQRSHHLSPEQRADIFQPSSALRSTDTVPDTYATSPATPDQQEFPSIPQKRNFTPLTGQSIRTDLLFTPSVAPSTPDRDEDLDEGTPESEENSRHGHELHEDGGEDSIMTEESEYERYPPRARPSRWDRTLSPIKSSLRSPLKPKTPGKVVEFAEYGSASLAPAQPSAFARPTAGMSDAPSNGVRGQRPSPADPNPAQDDKENGPSPPKDDFFPLPAATNLRGNAAVEPVKNGNLRLAPFEAGKGAGLKPTTTGATIAAPPIFPKSSLSKTNWSRPHWIRLDELLQLRRRDPLAFQRQQQQRLTPHLLHDKDRRSSPGVLRALVGKEVTAQGERVLLEPWHLEVVEAFRNDVGGWDEEELAKRLFALIIGEERRNAAKAFGGGTRKIFT